MFFLLNPEFVVEEELSRWWLWDWGTCTAQAYNLPFLSPYFEALNSDFGHGVNFAASSAGARRVIYRGCPFTLPIQLQQYRRFKLTTLSTGMYVPKPC
jgi:hypothetical protein